MGNLQKRANQTLSESLATFVSDGSVEHLVQILSVFKLYQIIQFEKEQDSAFLASVQKYLPTITNLLKPKHSKLQTNNNSVGDRFYEPDFVSQNRDSFEIGTYKLSQLQPEQRFILVLSEMIESMSEHLYRSKESTKKELPDLKSSSQLYLLNPFSNQAQIPKNALRHPVYLRQLLKLARINAESATQV